jgi:P27 family predicted phage terminase small subunit
MPHYRNPDSKKRVSGTFRPDRAKKKPEAEALGRVPPAPAHLSPLAREKWQKLAAHIVRNRTLSQGDLAALELLVTALAMASQAQTALDEQGIVIGASDGAMRPHPAIKILEQARAQATRLLTEFGMTPRSRQHVEAAPPPPAANPFSEF